MTCHECGDEDCDYIAPKTIVEDVQTPAFIKDYFRRFTTRSDIDCDIFKLKIPPEYYIRRDST